MSEKEKINSKLSDNSLVNCLLSDLQPTHPTVQKYNDHIKPYIVNKRVLDLGAVQHDVTATESDGWLHRLISEDAAKVIGVDIVSEAVRDLQREGWDIREGDAERLDLNEARFETIVAGELIEHLDNFEGFFQSVDRNLTEDGYLIITTPNSMSLYWTLKQVTDDSGDWVNDEHSCWFDATTLSQLLTRFGYEVVEINYVRTSRAIGIRSVSDLTGWLASYILPPRAGYRNLVLVAERK
jgi:2-polyprenyl-3-methyl-5-hydroxy-6-metoxy-1,4-benzoquinol methylase